MLNIKDIKVIYEDNHLIAVNKPAGWLVQGDKTGDTPLSDYVKEYIRIKYKKPGKVFLGVIHRLDRPVSGAVIFAKTSKALVRMNKLFETKKILKTYLAIVKERPDPINGTLVHFLVKNHERNVSKAYEKLSNRNKSAKKSTLEYELIGEIGDFHLLKVNPITGRPHQIRVQLAEIGCPIIGDVKYGYRKANQDSRIHLHCRMMEFEHPVKLNKMRISAPKPKEQLWNNFKQIG